MARNWDSNTRRGFSLTEMLVSIAVLIVAIAVVTNVFSISAKTAATAQAIAEVEANLQRFGADLEADLQGINTAESVLALYGREQAAARNEDLRQAGRYWRVMTGDPALVTSGYNPAADNTPQPVLPNTSARGQYSDPRADIMMFFTTTARASRMPSSVTPPLNDMQRGLQLGARHAPVQCVWGHASFATPTRAANGVLSFPPAAGVRHIERAGAGESPLRDISRIPLNLWTVGVRRTLIEDVSTGASRFVGTAVTTVPSFKDTLNPIADGNAIAFSATWDRLTQGYAMPGSNNSNFAVDSAAFRFRDFLTFFAPRTNADGTVLMSPEPRGLALASPYDLSENRRWNFFNGARRQIIDNIMYHPNPVSVAHHHVLTLSDKPLPELVANQAMASLPGCAWFQIEFLMPEDPRNSRLSPVSSQRDEMPRWVEIEPGKTYVFVPDTQENRALIASQTNFNNVSPGDGRPLVGSQWDRLNTFGQVIPPQTGPSENWQPGGALDRSSNRRIRTWPYAIRVTVRVFDVGGKLEEPITRTFVHRFGD